MRFQQIGVIGAGVMGIGMSTDLVLHNMSCVLVDVSRQALERARLEIVKLLRFAPLLDAQLPKVEAEEAIERSTFTTRLEAVASCDFIIENATEDWAIKQAIYQQLSAICPQTVPFAANTSCISITKIASATDRPEHTIGTHFMNPVYLKKSVEVIRGFHTSESCIALTNTLLEQLGKEAR